MQVVCKQTNGNAELHCCVCGQGFVMFWDRHSAAERMAARHEIQEALRQQHRGARGREAHPQSSFLVPEWNGSAAQITARPGEAPVWEL